MIDDLAEISGRRVSRETFEKIQAYQTLLREEAKQQNLVSAATLSNLWRRHILDSAQLARFGNETGSWADIGSGAGLPGLVLALLVVGPVLLIEPRRLRAEFLQRCVDDLRLGDQVTVVQAKVQDVEGTYDMITARAVATVDKLLTLSTHLSTKNTLWVLPKGRSAQSELAEAQARWQCEAETVASRTDPESEILLLRNVRARGRK